MIREMRPCLACGHPIALICVEEKDVGEVHAEVTSSTVPIHPSEIGWWDVECSYCGLHTPSDLAEARFDKQVEGFFISWGSEEEILNWLRIFLRECPEAQQKAREILEKC